MLASLSLFLANWLPYEKDKFIKYNKHCVTIIVKEKISQNQGFAFWAMLFLAEKPYVSLNYSQQLRLQYTRSGEFFAMT
jgi:hypothetical protein